MTVLWTLATGEGDIPEPNTSDKYIVSKTEYDSAGRPYRSYDNRNKFTHRTYDDRGRAMWTYENYVNGTSSSGETDSDRETLIERDPEGRVVAITAGNANSSSVSSQSTVFTYECDYDASLPTAISYPDSDTTTMTYDRLGRKVTTTDQRGAVHTYEYDSAGRLYKDSITTVPASDDFFDDSVRRIQSSFDDIGRLEKITSYDDASSGSAVNEVKFTYNGWGQVSKSQQNHTGAVDQNSPAVDYYFEDGIRQLAASRAVGAVVNQLPNGENPLRPKYLAATEVNAGVGGAFGHGTTGQADSVGAALTSAASVAYSPLFRISSDLCLSWHGITCAAAGETDRRNSPTATA